MSGVVGFAGADRRQPDREHRAHVHPAEAVRPARRLGPADHPAAAAQGRRRCRASSSSCRPGRTSASAAGSAAPQYQYTLTDTDTDELNHWAPIVEEAMAQAARAAGRRLRPADRRAASRDRRSTATPPRGSGSRSADRRDALRRLRPAPGRDDLHLDQPVQGRSSKCSRRSRTTRRRCRSIYVAGRRTARRSRSARSRISPPRSSRSRSTTRASSRR